MSFLEAAIMEIADLDLREQFQDRLDIVRHKIKFMDTVPVACLTTLNTPADAVFPLLEAVGGEPVLPEQAQVLLYWQHQTDIPELMGAVPQLLDAQWPAVKYSRVYLWKDEFSQQTEPEVLVSALEHLAEMLYPGFFVFGGEGEVWTSFKTQ
ncbi:MULTISPECIES: hypothetical protein [Pedobacter]|uniref:hypothetical protein n=1 Tax=Pedobacter TaxID=84567 RepID=UPI00210B99A8|nr:MULTISPECIES: hypothetical protein [unclassified Pedobacter]